MLTKVARRRWCVGDRFRDEAWELPRFLQLLVGRVLVAVPPPHNLVILGCSGLLLLALRRRLRLPLLLRRWWRLRGDLSAGRGWVLQQL